MSEKLHQSHEKAAETVDAHAEAKHNLERIKKSAEAKNEAEQQHMAEVARDKAEHEAISGKDVSVEDKKDSKASGNSGFAVEKNLKATAYKKQLERIRDHLSPTERTFSKFTHAKVVDKTSNVMAKTVARPTGILGGAVCALIGSVIALYTAKHYGFTYNYLLFLALFVGGYLIGSSIELLLWVVVGRRRHTS